MEYLQRLLDKIDRFELLIAGLVGAVIASWWHKDDLANWRTWVIFLITGGASSLHLAGMVSAYRSSKHGRWFVYLGGFQGDRGGDNAASIDSNHSRR